MIKIKTSYGLKQHRVLNGTKYGVLYVKKDTIKENFIRDWFKYLEYAHEF